MSFVSVKYSYILAVVGLCSVISLAQSEESEVYKSGVRANNLFSNDIYKVLAESEGNVLCSPFSIRLALALLHPGSTGKTAEELSHGLHLDEKAVNGYESLSSIKKDLQSSPNINVASAAFIEQTLQLKQKYKDVTQSYFGAEPHSVNFKEDAEGTRQYVNKWVSNQTRKKIQELFSSGEIGPGTKLVLASVVYFEAEWEDKFHPGFTFDRTFYVAENKAITVSMMTKHHHRCPYYEADWYQAIQLPYKDSNFSMLILLPKKINGLSELEKYVTSVDFQDVLSKLNTSIAEIYIPKFTSETSLELNDALKKLNMNKMFTDEAELPEIYEQAGNSLRVDKVIHKTYIEVAEEGTKAAAATGIASFGVSPVGGVPDFVADHPFLFYVLYKNTVIFAGRYVGPAALKRA